MVPVVQMLVRSQPIPGIDVKDITRTEYSGDAIYSPLRQRSEDDDLNNAVTFAQLSEKAAAPAPQATMDIDRGPKSFLDQSSKGVAPHLIEGILISLLIFGTFVCGGIIVIYLRRRKRKRAADDDKKRLITKLQPPPSPPYDPMTDPIELSNTKPPEPTPIQKPTQTHVRPVIPKPLPSANPFQEAPLSNAYDMLRGKRGGSVIQKTRSWLTNPFTDPSSNRYDPFGHLRAKQARERAAAKQAEYNRI